MEQVKVESYSQTVTDEDVKRGYIITDERSPLPGKKLPIRAIAGDVIRIPVAAFKTTEQSG